MMLTIVAATIAAPAGAAEPGFYAGVDLGAVEPDVGKSDGITAMSPGSFPTHFLPLSTRSDGSESSWSAWVGYRINRYFAGEIAYEDLGSVDIVELYDLGDGSAPAPSTSSTQVTGPLISVRGILPIGEKFEAFARAGVLFGAQELRLSSGPSVFRGSVDDVAVQPWVFGVGFDFAWSEQWTARVEFQSVQEISANAITGAIRHQRFAIGMVYGF
jgi:opacity protein-like surface antigen